MSKIQSKNHELGTYETNKIYLPYFNDEIYLLDNCFDALKLGA